MCIYIYIFIYSYTYIYRERGRYTDICIDMHALIYRYICVCAGMRAWGVCVRACCVISVCCLSVCACCP